MKVLYRNAIAATLRNYFIGASKQSGTLTFNQNVLFERVHKAKDQVILTQLYADELREVPRTWQYVLAVLHDDGDEVYYNYESGACTNSTSDDINEFAPRAMKEFISEVVDGHEKSWFWLVAPNNNNDVEASIETYVDTFNEYNLLDLPKEEFKQLKETRRLMRKKAMAA